uniref:Uncharacterized protein n=1 Tax=Romanomermis culicivorax TaxID=13658 RepID=A0A915HVH7_ROMCU
MDRTTGAERYRAVNFDFANLKNHGFGTGFKIRTRKLRRRQIFDLRRSSPGRSKSDDNVREAKNKDATFVKSCKINLKPHSHESRERTPINNEEINVAIVIKPFFVTTIDEIL